LSWLKHTNQKGGSKAGGSSNDKAIALNDDDEDSEDASVDNENDTGGGPHLVIAPSSVLANWKREFDNFAPHLNVVKYHGTQSERLELQEQLRLHLPGREANRRRLGLEPLDVILAPVTYFQKEKSDDRTFLKRFGYDYLVVDEAHMVCKNAKGTRYKSLNKFVTSHRLLLTGTPVQSK
jgi:SWI/SNF-related matrix-associated actin-dependent regulator 1 of chromatin subfamily A